MKKRTIAIIISIVSAILIALIIFASKDNTAAPDSTQTARPAQQQAPANNQSTANQEEKVYSSEEVANHKTASDCWTIIDGKVYDITAYVSRHPGGNEILRACGADGSTLFNNRTSSDGQKIGSGTPHSRTAASQLEQFKIGTLSQN